MKKIVYTVSLLVIAIICLQKYSGSTNPNEIKEDHHIDAYLREIFSGDLGFTLIGVKPISFTTCYNLKYYPKEKHELFLFLKSTFNNSPRFILKIFDQPYCPHNIVLIHKAALQQTILQEPLLQSFVELKYGNIENFFSDLQNPQKDLPLSFDFDLVTTGIALGYGEKNSAFFKRRLFLANKLNKTPTMPRSSCMMFPSLYAFRPVRDAITESISRKKPYFFEVTPQVDAARFSSLEQEWEWIEANRLPITYLHPPLLFQLPIFIALKGPETDQIYAQLQYAKDRLEKLFAERPIREIIIEEATKNF